MGINSTICSFSTKGYERIYFFNGDAFTLEMSSFITTTVHPHVDTNKDVYLVTNSETVIIRIKDCLRMFHPDALRNIVITLLPGEVPEDMDILRTGIIQHLEKEFPLYDDDSDPLVEDAVKITPPNFGEAAKSFGSSLKAMRESLGRFADSGRLTSTEVTTRYSDSPSARHSREPIIVTNTTVLDAPPTLSEDRMVERKAYAIKQAKFDLFREIEGDESLWELKEEIDRFTGKPKITVTLVVLKK